MNTNMTGFRCFSKYLRSCAMEESSLLVQLGCKHTAIVSVFICKDPNSIYGVYLPCYGSRYYNFLVRQKITCG